jgi:Tol biopolymer transport system component
VAIRPITRRTALFAAALLPLLPCVLGAQPAAGGPTAAGIYTSPIAAGGITYLWNEDGFFRVRFGPVVEEITDSTGAPLRSVRGVAPAPAAQGAIWFWTEDRLLSLLSLQSAAAEITRPGGGPLSGIRGAVVDAAGAVWIWTGDGLFLHRSGTQAQEVTAPGGASLADLAGVIPVPQGALAWGRQGVFAVLRLTGAATPVPAPGGGPIQPYFAGGVVVSGSVPRVWNGDRAWVVTVGFGATQEITDGAGSPLTGVRGMAAGAGGLVWLWTGRGVFGHGFGTQATEILFQGSSIPDVRGLVSGPSGTTWFWTQDRLLAHQLASVNAVEITSPGGGAIRDVQGLISGGGGGTFLWTDRRVLGFQAGGTSTLEITAPGGGPLAGVRGIVAGPGRTVIWNDSGVFLHRPATMTTVEVTTPRGGPIRNAWAAVPRADGGDVWIRNHAATYALGLGTTTATEILAPDGDRIESPPYNLPLTSVALTRTVGAGVGARDSFAPGVTFAGEGLSGAVLAGFPIPFPLGLIPVVAGGGLQTGFLHTGSPLSTLSAAGGAVLATGEHGDFVSLAISFETGRASMNAGGQEGDDRSGDPSVGAGGRFIAFGSEASNLVPGDTNGSLDVFVHDRLTATTVRAAPPGVEPNGASVFPAISADGRHVSFTSGATNLVAGDTNGQTDVFVWDRGSGAVERVNLRAGGGQALGGFSSGSAISADGRFVTYDSSAGNLVPGDSNGAQDVFVRDRAAGTTERVSVSSSGAQANEASVSPAISADGRFVAFVSFATNLVPGDTNGSFDVFVHDRVTGWTERVSVSSAGAQQTGVPVFDSATPAISADGRFVAFDSTAPNLVPGDTNGTYDVFVRDRAAGTTERVSLTDRDRQANGFSRGPSLSADGRFVAFASAARNLLGPGTEAGQAIFVRDRVARTTRKTSFTFLDSANQTELGGFDPSISGDGRFVAFSSSGETRAGAMANGVQDVLVRDLGAPDSLFPWIVHGGGATELRSDAFVHNPADHPLVLDLTYFKRGLRDPGRPVEGLTVGPHETAFLENLLPELLGVDPGSGAVELGRVHFYSDAEPVATFQIRNPAPGGGSYGQAGSAQPLTGGDRAATRVQTLLGLNLTADKLTFLGFNNLRQKRAVYDLAFFDRQGNPVGRPQRGLVLGPDVHKQFSAVELSSVFDLEGREDFRVQVTTRSGGPVHAFASTFRTDSEDTIFIPAARPGRPVVHVVGAQATAGARGTRWTTDAILHNPAAVPVEVRMTFTKVGLRAQPQPLGPPVALAPGETVRLREVLQNRGVASGVGVLTFESDGTPEGIYPVVAAETIETSSAARLFGRYSGALRDEEAAGEGKRSILVGLRQNADHATTLWLFNPSDLRGDFQLRYLDLDGHAVATSRLAVGRGKLVQIDPGQLPNELDGLPAFTLEVVVHRGRLLTAAAVVSTSAGDPVSVIGETR